MDIHKAKRIPRHVAIIMDGNGRWAQGRLQPRIFGHRNGAKRVRDVVEAAGEQGVKYLTLYAFSEENWNRPVDEVKGLFRLLSSYLRDELAHLNENNVRLRSIGERDRLPRDCQDLLEKAEKSTAGNDGLQLVLALSYGSRSDLVQGMKRLASLIKRGELEPEDITEKMVAQSLSTADIPDPDLLIRTSGEQRVSNFLLWEISYSEMYFTPKHWPEFGKKDFAAALEAYAARDRRFGRVPKGLFMSSKQISAKI
ncbi:undecaprenyl diphosphate synthase [Pseudobacteriovorax antillogorgiicola]|uniref:Isoprenyl transferase n=2 Tax=Pseudobacteriovorax antillogorgiicola TaxID=1513793 RepID=A0A1Y6B345_9BACT|nr:undecaprenyl diphosphate synthase [Pseudobacteriovorax antillogorgiicola]SME87764.1 undecaprenyl diphosphate synthase [Pseudobacteriovorax antillogorgiicola]